MEIISTEIYCKSAMCSKLRGSSYHVVVAKGTGRRHKTASTATLKYSQQEAMSGIKYKSIRAMDY